MSITGKVSKRALQIKDKKSGILHEEDNLGAESEKDVIGEEKKEKRKHFDERKKPEKNGIELRKYRLPRWLNG